MRRTLAFAAVALAAAAGLAGCHGKSSTTGASSANASETAAGHMVVVKNFSFAPADLTVPTGTAVTWRFEDAAQHTVQFAHPAVTSPALSAGRTYTYLFNSPGTYAYICSIHQYMHATVTVTGR